MLSDCGLKVTMLELSQEDYVYNLANRNYDIYVGQTKLSPNMDLSAFFADGGSLSYGELADETLYYMNQEALANSGNYYNLHEQIMENGNLIPLVFRGYAVYATRGVVTELTPARDNLFYYDTGRTLEDAFTTE